MKRHLEPISNRTLVSMHLEMVDVYGNSTSIMYYYTNVYVGGQNQTMVQSLILDTGSGITCFPCQNTCSRCGKHLNPYYKIDNSETAELLNCKTDNCVWVSGEKWYFDQKYGEGSLYEGYWVKDHMYLNDDLHEQDYFKFTFGCVTTETNLFYTQQADGKPTIFLF